MSWIFIWSVIVSFFMYLLKHQFTFNFHYKIFWNNSVVILSCQSILFCEMINFFIVCHIHHISSFHLLQILTDKWAEKKWKNIDVIKINSFPDFKWHRKMLIHLKQIDIFSFYFSINCRLHLYNIKNMFIYLA